MVGTDGPRRLRVLLVGAGLVKALDSGTFLLTSAIAFVLRRARDSVGRSCGEGTSLVTETEGLRRDRASRPHPPEDVRGCGRNGSGRRAP